jgi:hypothetical protein
MTTVEVGLYERIQMRQKTSKRNQYWNMQTQTTIHSTILPRILNFIANKNIAFARTNPGYLPFRTNHLGEKLASIRLSQQKEGAGALQPAFPNQQCTDRDE